MFLAGVQNSVDSTLWHFPLSDLESFGVGLGQNEGGGGIVLVRQLIEFINSWNLDMIHLAGMASYNVGRLKLHQEWQPSVVVCSGNGVACREVPMANEKR